MHSRQTSPRQQGSGAARTEAHARRLGDDGGSSGLGSSGGDSELGGGVSGDGEDVDGSGVDSGVSRGGVSAPGPQSAWPPRDLQQRKGREGGDSEALDGDSGTKKAASEDVRNQWLHGTREQDAEAVACTRQNSTHITRESERNVQGCIRSACELVC